MPLQDWIHNYPQVAKLLQGDEELLYPMDEDDVALPPLTDEEARRPLQELRTLYARFCAEECREMIRETMEEIRAGEMDVVFWPMDAFRREDQA